MHCISPALRQTWIVGRPWSDRPVLARPVTEPDSPLTEISVRTGEVLTAETRPGKTWERESKRAGKWLFSDRITDFRDQNGELVVSVRSVSVKTERPVDPR